MIVYRCKKIIISFAIIHFFWSCKGTKEIAYSYNVETYGIGTEARKQLYYFSSIISYGDYLFEFKIQTNSNTEIHGEADPVKSITYDTTGVYLLSGKNEQYCEFDSFALKSSIIKTGRLSDKQYGMKLSSPVKSDSSETFYGSLQKVFINNIQCYYVDIISKNITAKDTVEQKIALIKKEHFNSLYKTSGIEFPNKDYCIIGFNMYFPAKKEYLKQEIKNLRVLTEKEKLICRSMVKISGH